MDVQVTAGLRHRHPALPDKLDRLDLELSTELSSPHDHLRLNETPKLGVHQTGNSSYITHLPKVEQKLDEWQATIEALMMAAEGRGPLMHARIGILRTLNRNVEQTFHPDRKDKHWGRRKLKRDK
jgi:hypothetical protein